MALEKYEPLNSDYNGRVYSWGSNGEGYGNYQDPCSIGGRLGNGTYVDSNTPVLVLAGKQNPNDPNSYLEHIVAIAAGEAHSMALDANRYVYCWGDNYHGQLGNGTNDPCTTPVKVVGPDGVGYLENVVAISAGYWHSLAIDANGTIWTWGKGSAGRLGLGNKAIDCDTPHPIPVVYNITQETFALAIQTAIDDANDAGDTLEASPGTYYENVNFGIKALTLQSQAGNFDVVSSTVIDGSYSWSSAVSLYGNPGSTLAGFTVTNRPYNGIASYQSELSVINCIVRDNGAYGIFEYNPAGAAVIANSIIRGNGDDGIYFYCDGLSLGPEIANNWIYNNGGSGVKTDYAYYAPDPSAAIVNNTIVGNDEYGVESNYATDVEITNCIIWDNGDDPNDDNLHAEHETFNVTYSCLQGSYAGTGGNIDSDPCFIDAEGNDFHLDANSLCIDAGDPDFTGDVNETDMDGEPRVMDGDANGTRIVDMGADEFYWSEADYSGDGIVNFIDYALLTSYWQDAGIDYNDVFLDGDSNSDGLAEFCDVWLWEGGFLSGSMPLMAGRGGAGIVEGLGFDAELSAVAVPEREPAVAEPVDIEAVMKWLAEIWLDPDVQKSIDEEKFLEVYESLKGL
jgi:hypothetical protein